MNVRNEEDNKKRRNLKDPDIELDLVMIFEIQKRN